jgi:hypothetical protein
MGFYGGYNPFGDYGYPAGGPMQVPVPLQHRLQPAPRQQHLPMERIPLRILKSPHPKRRDWMAL